MATNSTTVSNPVVIGGGRGSGRGSGLRLANGVRTPVVTSAIATSPREEG